ncbi:MAG: ECF transporter S component [Defluviitaleaceae bacterium]|nr:ECF transporter S component [Defluviitaleaceae bacterium]
MFEKRSVKVMVRASLLGSISVILKQLNITLPIFPSFLDLDISDVPAIVGAITTGPLTGLLIVLIKNLIDPILFGTTTAGIGNLGNFVMGSALVVPIGIVFQKRRDSLGYLLGGVLGILCTVIAAVFMNYFVLLPLFDRFFIPMETIIAIAHAVNSNVTSKFTLIIFAIIPFNLLKATLVVAIGFLIYRALRPVMERLRV